jgi:ABC-type transport system substrate-binding protein
MKKILFTILTILILMCNFAFVFDIPVSKADSLSYRVFIYYDIAYPTSWITEKESFFFKEFLSRVFSNYSVPFEVVDAVGLKNVCLNTSYANENIIIMTRDVAPDTIWDGSFDGSIIENWLEAGGIMIWTGDWEFFYIGHNDTTMEHIDGIENYVFDQTVTTFGLMFTFPTTESLSILPGFDRLYTCRPSTKNLLSNLHCEAWGSYKIGDVEYLDPVLFQAGSNGLGYFIKVGMATDCTVLCGKLIAEIVLNRFLNLGVEVPPKRVEVFDLAFGDPYFTLDIIVPGYYEDPDLTPYQSSPPARLNWSRIIASNLNNLGIKVKLHFVDWPQEANTCLIPPSGHMQPLGGTYEEGGFDAFFIGWSTLPREGITIWNVTEYLRGAFHSSSIPPDSSQNKFNYIYWNDSYANALLDLAASASNESEAEVCIKEWQNIFYEEQPSALLFYAPDVIVNGTYYIGHQELGFNMRHPILGSGIETPIGKANASKAAESAKCVRQAISYAIPRQALIETLNLQNSTPGITPVHPLMPGFNTQLQPFKYNLTKAIELVAKAGYTGIPTITVDDDFNDNKIDNSKWAISSSPTGHVSEINGKLQLELTNESTGEYFEACLDSIWVVDRDFDVQVDYELINWTTKNGMKIGLQAGPPTSRGAPDIVERVSDFAGSEECYLTHFSDGVYGVTPTDHMSGKLRIVRIGSTVTGYYFNETRWVALHSALTETGYGNVRLALWGHDTCPGVVVAFDNFTVNFGYVIGAITKVETYTPLNVTEFFTLHIYLPTWNPLRVEWGRKVAQSLTEIGIKVHLLFSPSRNFIFDKTENRSLYENGGYDACFIGWAFGLSTENMTEIAYNLRELYHSNSISNYYNWNNSENDQLLDAAATSNDTILTEQYLKQWQKLYYEEQPSPILFYFLSNYTINQQLMLNMLHPIFGTGVATPLGMANSSRAAEAAKYVRQAISYAIPRQQIAEELNLTTNPEYMGLGITPYHPLWQGFDGTLHPYEYNLTKAKELLAKAGYGITITAACPVNLWITDSQERHVGTNPETGEAVIEIPGATYSGPNLDPQVIWIPHPEGSYNISVVGIGSGTYTLKVIKITEDTFIQNISQGATHTYITTVTDNQSRTTAIYSLNITSTTGGTTNPVLGTYNYEANTMVQVTAIPNSGYQFDYWELDDVNVGSANPYTVIMDNDHTLKAVFSVIPPPLSTAISPLSASILVGQSVTFTSTVSGGYTPYAYQWFLNGNPVLGATSETWAFTPTTSGIYYVYLKVTDGKGNTAQSDAARITVATVPVGGYSVLIDKYTIAKPLIIYTALVTILTAVFAATKRKTTRKKGYTS